ncbi:MAG TPA: amidophosphoribosyltransferase, partial [Burkholderiales bacterium]
MCGIVGLLVKKPELRAQLGELMYPMLIGMTERGPDSAGMAVFTAPVGEGQRKFSLYSGGDDFNWAGLAHDIHVHLGVQAEVASKGNHAVLTCALAPEAVKVWLREHYPQLHLLSVGRHIDLYKDTGTPAQVAERYRFRSLAGTHLVGHTRMATESAVTPDRAHPFTAGEDFC